MRSKDRLAELRNIANGAVVYNPTVELDVKTTTNNELNKIFEEVEQMRCWIHDLNGNTQLIKRLYADPTYHNNKQIQDQLDSAISKSNALGLKICGALRQFERRVTSHTTTTHRLARLQYVTVRKLYGEALEEHQLTVQRVKEEEYALLQEQMRLTNLTISDEECQNLLETKNISLFVDNIAAETIEARRQLNELECRRDDLLRVEKALEEIRDLFQQLAHLVAQQQDSIDTVEYFAGLAGHHVGGGGEQLKKGSVTRRKARNKKVSLIICLVSGFLLVLLVLIIT